MIDAGPGGDTLVDRASAAFTAYRDGDRDAFDSLVEMATPLLWHAARSQNVSRLGAEDVLQSVWLGLLHSADSVREPRAIIKWLLTSVRREAWRVASREREASGLRPAGDDAPTDAAADPDAAPDVTVFRHQREERLWRHVRALAPRCRELLRVIAFADRPDYALIARSLGMPVGSIGPTRGRCLAKLRNLLETDPEWEAW